MALQPTPVGDTYRGHLYHHAPRNVYWETTLACDLACKHCRANANPNADPRQLSTEEGKRIIEATKRMGSMLVLTGGDPLKRSDLFELIEYGRGLGVPVAVTPSTTPLLTRESVQRFKDLHITAMGVSLDGPNAEIHDGFRNVPGTFDCSMRALGWAREFDIPVQVNTTITAETLKHLPAMYELLSGQHAPPVRRWSLFMLVPTGRGTDLGAPTAEQVEELFAWIYEISPDAPFRVGTTEAPHYRRYWIQRKLAEGMSREAIDKLSRAMSFGIRDGNGVVFVSHVGEVYPAGFLPYPLLGNVRDRPLDEIYREEPRLRLLRDPANYNGRCGACEFKWACGGSRARAYSMTGDELGSDPLCAHEPGVAAE
jgi:radical SAM protein